MEKGIIQIKPNLDWSVLTMRCIACNKILQTFSVDTDLCNECRAWKDRLLYGPISVEDIEEIFNVEE
jgi:hypothetical protein